MKYNFKIVIIFFVLFLVAGCSDNNPTESIFSKYSGSWQLFKISGGFSGSTHIIGRETTIIINYGTFSAFRLTRNDTLRVFANFRIAKSEYGNDIITYSNVITYNYDFYPKLIYAQIYSDTLIISDGYADGYSYFYKKIH
jgi:hypothetical protein